MSAAAVKYKLSDSRSLNRITQIIIVGHGVYSGSAEPRVAEYALYFAEIGAPSKHATGQRVP
jgi:hypothetical protein